MAPATHAARNRSRGADVEPSAPGGGYNKLSDWLKLEDTNISVPTIQRILNDKGMSTRYECWLKLEARHAEDGKVGWPQTNGFIERFLRTDGQERIL